MDARPIGVFDSGVGGLTVLKELREVLPNENFIYVGDNLRVPYGTKTKKEVASYVKEISGFLEKENVKMIVIACNTATALGMKEASRKIDLPFVGVIEPGARAAVRENKNNKIALIATEATVKSESYPKAIKNLSGEKDVISLACPDFVKLVEAGLEDSIDALEAAERYLSEYDNKGIDTLVMGCTHFPVLERTIEKVLGEEVKLVNPAIETALEVKDLLEKREGFSPLSREGWTEFFVTGDKDSFQEVGSNILGQTIEEVKMIDIENM